MNDAKKLFRAGKAAFSRKKIYYNNDANAIGFGFISLVFESSGKMHEESKEFFKHVIMQAAEIRMILFPCLWKYWMPSIIFVNHRQHADTVFKRSILSHKQKDTDEDYTFDDYAIRDTEYLRY